MAGSPGAPPHRRRRLVLLAAAALLAAAVLSAGSAGGALRMLQPPRQAPTVLTTYHPLPCEARRAGGGWSAAACVDCARYAAPKDVARHRVFFMHLGKCGGTTLNIQLKALAERLGLTWARHVRACNASINVGHSITYPLLRECAVDFREAITFTMLREPLQRILSSYRYLQDDPRESKRSHTRNFTAFVREKPRGIQKMLGDRNTTAMKARLLELDVVGITERPAETYAAVYYLLGAAADVPARITKLNVQLGPRAPLVGERDVAAQPEPGKGPITAREAALLLAHNAQEVELYAFAREVFASQLACLQARPFFRDRLARYRAAFNSTDVVGTFLGTAALRSGGAPPPGAGAAEVLRRPK